MFESLQLPGFHCHAIESKNQGCSIDKSRILEMEGGEYSKIPLLPRAGSAIFHLQDTRRSVLHKFIELSLEMSCWCTSERHQHDS